MDNNERNILQSFTKNPKRILKDYSKVNDTVLLLSHWKNVSDVPLRRGPIEWRLAKVLSLINDLDILDELWRKSTKKSRPRELIEAQITEALSLIDNIAVLRRHWVNTFATSKPEKLIKARMIELFRDVIQSTDSLKVLAGYLGNNSRGPVPREIVEAQMIKVLEPMLPTIDDFGTLQYLSRYPRKNSPPAKLIERRMAELLPSINSLETLGEIWKEDPAPKKLKGGARALIEGRMAEILESIDNFADLGELWDMVPGALLEKRMMEILEIELPLTSDLKVLQKYWEITTTTSKPEECILERMTIVLESIDSLRVLLGHKRLFPAELQPGKLIGRRIEEILDSLTEPSADFIICIESNDFGGLESIFFEKAKRFLE